MGQTEQINILTVDQVINDIFSELGHISTRESVTVAINAYANQFKWIETTCGKRIEFDDLDYNVLRQQALFLATDRKCVMALWISDNGKKTVAPVAKLLVGSEGKSVIHYKDRNPLNLKRNNIEVVNHQKASFKSKKPTTHNGITPTSIYKGVSYSKFAKKWSAYIKVDGVKKHLGYFVEEINAAKAYNEAATKFYGKEYCELNTF